MGDKAPKWTTEDWKRVLLKGEDMWRRERSLLRRVPSSPRCMLCLAPFTGLGGRVLGVIGFRPSRKNPRFCNNCFERAPMGGAEVETGILFADIRGFTSMSESRPPEEMAGLLNRFYRIATDALAAREAVIDKLAGDQVMALFLPGFAGEEYLTKMIDGAEALLRGLGYGNGQQPWLAVGIGLDWGQAFVGNIGSGEVKDFTAIGDVVNTAARLQAEARPGQIVMSERLYELSGGRFPQARAVELQLKGKSQPLPARVVDLAKNS